MSNETQPCSAKTEQIYFEFKNRVQGYIKSRVSDTYAAEELLSTVFLKIHEHIGSYDSGKATLSTWVYAITRNTVNDYLRRFYKTAQNEPFEDTLIDCVDNELPVLEKIINDEQLEMLAEALEQLPEREKDIIILRFYYERTAVETAAAMSLSHENVRYLQHVAIARLRKIMGSSG